jgi:transcriptional regulator with XRE-family HTH domain
MRKTKELLGARIKELRRAKGLSQDKLSEKVDIDPKHLSRIEVGGSFPSLDTLANLAEALKVELKDFFEFAHKAENPRELKGTLNSLMKEATEEELRMVVKVLRAITR